MPEKRKPGFFPWVIAASMVLATIIVVSTENAPIKANDSPPAVAPYVGSAPCKICHAKIYDPWASSVHGKVLSPDSLPEQIRGCEACHGPGGIHVGSGEKNKLPVPSADNPAATNVACGNCHFKSDSSKSPKEWQNLSPADWANGAHQRKGLSCLSCHTGHPNGNDKALIKPAKELCLTCHASVLEESPGKAAAYTHSPVALGQCISCHDPHGGNGQHMTVDKIDSTCTGCHKPTDPKIAVAHLNYPIADSKCVSCHNPHSHDRTGKLIPSHQHMPFQQRKCELCHNAPEPGKPVGLSKPANQLCFSCHPASTLMPTGENAHIPAKEGMCTSCHNPHASDDNALLKTKPAYACFTCHSKVHDSTLKKYRHKILEANLDCLLCHKPHSSVNDNLLSKPQMDLCGQCHKHKFSHPMGAKADGTKVIDKRTNKTLVCASCHEVHGSDFETMTTGDKHRDLCLKCHDVGH